MTLTQDFWAMTTEVTQGVFEQLMGYHPSVGSLAPSHGLGDNIPGYNISWSMAADFSNSLTEYYIDKWNKFGCYTCSGSEENVSCVESINPYECAGFRLPTEAEWEYSARSGTSMAFWTVNGGEIIIS